LQVDPDLGASDLRRLSTEIEGVIEARGGLAAARRRARTIGLTYATLSPLGQQRFFEHLATAHDRDRAAVDRAIDAVLAAGDGADRRRSESELRRVLRPGHETLLRRLAGQDGGLAFLVELRADLLDHRRRSPELASLDTELHQILENWFDVGLLELVRLTWDTSASLLEKLIVYEAVHAIESWDDLKRRLGPGRRCYAFVHPAMPDDPLIFVEVALTEGTPARLDPLLEPGVADDQSGDGPGSAPLPEDRADTAVFYSISNCHRGLAGVSLGDFLIKSVAEELSAELTGLRTHVTLSPLPGFRAWLADQAEAGDEREAGPVPLSEVDPDPDADEDELWSRLGALVDGPPRARDDVELERLRPAILHLAARYVTGLRPDGRAIDPVANFHLSNGARVERLNWMANPTSTGWERGLGLMVNYRYDLRTIEDNHQRYVGDHRVTVGDEVRSLLEPRSGDRRRWR
jgi:malonyl-CoA decarboxylase